MSLSALPLPLELAQPIHLAGDLDGMLRDSLHLGRYDPKMQMGSPVGDGSCETNSESSADSSTRGNFGLIIVDLQLDFAIFDDILQDFQNTGPYDTESESEADSSTTDNEGLVIIDLQADLVAIDDIIQDFQNV